VVAPARAPTSLKRPRNVSLRTCLRGEIEGMLPLDSNAGPAVREAIRAEGARRRQARARRDAGRRPAP